MGQVYFTRAEFSSWCNGVRYLDNGFAARLNVKSLRRKFVADVDLKYLELASAWVACELWDWAHLN